MKRTLIFLLLLFGLTVLLLETTGSTLGTNTETSCCNVNFTVLKSGLPQRNVTITVHGTGGGQCTTDSTGKCSICVTSTTKGAIDTVTTTCGGRRMFMPCSTPVEVLECNSPSNN